jgi:hypothetical protein
MLPIVVAARGYVTFIATDNTGKGIRCTPGFGHYWAYLELSD